MLRSRPLRPRLLLTAPVALLALVLAAPSSAAADDEPEEPKRVRIKIEKVEENAEADPGRPHASPIEVLHHWFAAELGKADEGSALEARLRAWFAAGDDAPMAGLRDAFRAHGWDAATLSRWLAGHAGVAVREMFGPGLLRGRRPHGVDVRALRRRGPAAAHGHGPLHGPWMGGRERPEPHHGACPHCGHDANARAGFRRMPRRGMRGRSFRRRSGPSGMRGNRRPGWGHGPQSGPGAPGPRVQTRRRAFILWNDGHGWQRREVAPDGGAGARPRPAGPRSRRRMGPGPRGPAPGPRTHGTPEMRQLENLLEMLRAMQPGEGAPQAQKQRPGAAGGLDAEALRRALEMLRRLAPDAGPGPEGAPRALPWMEIFRAPGKKAAAPKRVKIKAPKPKRLEEVVVEEVEIEDVEIK